MIERILMRTGQIVRVKSSGEVGEVKGRIDDTDVYVVEVALSPVPEELPSFRAGFFVSKSYVRATEGNLMAITHVDQVEDRRQVLMNADLIVLSLGMNVHRKVVLTSLVDGYAVKWIEDSWREDSAWECKRT